LAILSVIKGEGKHIGETDMKTAFDLGIYLESEKCRTIKTDNVEIVKAIIDSVYEEQDNCLEKSQIIGDKPSKEKGEIIDDEVATDKPIKTEKSDKISKVLTKVVKQKSKTTKAKELNFILFCDVCKAKTGFKSRSAHQRHMLKAHKSVIKCDACSEPFSNYATFQVHMKTHLIECSECDKSFNSKKKLQHHIIYIHEQSEKLPCPHCGIFVKNMQIHINYKHIEKDLKICPVCDYTNKDMKQIDRHYRRVHTEIEITNCGFCGIVTKNLRRHLKTKQCDRALEEKVSLQCDDCGKQFSLQTSLEKHKKGIHQKIKDRKCPHCSYCTYSSYNLKLHVNKMHLGKKFEKEICLHCGKES